jgi:hypothetical protein
MKRRLSGSVASAAFIAVVIELFSLLVRHESRLAHASRRRAFPNSSGFLCSTHMCSGFRRTLPSPHRIVSTHLALTQI